MKQLKTFLVVTIVSFVLFYLCASIIEATLNIKEMRQQVRNIIFGSWLAILCLAAFGITTNINQNK